MHRWILIGVAMVFVHGCAGSDDEAESERVFDPLIESVDRAQDVQRIVDEQAEELRRRIEEAEGSAP